MKGIRVIEMNDQEVKLDSPLIWPFMIINILNFLIGFHVFNNVHAVYEYEDIKW